MGVQDFFNMIKEICPDVIVTTKLSQLYGWKVAVDVSIFLNKSIKTCGPERWIDNFIILLINLKKNGIKSICIFDGPNYPKEKQHERERRRAETAKANNIILYGKELYDKLLVLDQNEWASSDLKEEIKKLIIRDTIVGNAKGRKIDFSLLDSAKDALSDFIDKKERQTLPILPIYSEMAKKLITILGMNWFQADGEAEGLCASLCYHGMVDAVLSEDTDVLAYGTPYLFCKIDLGAETIVSVCYQDILNITGYTSSQFTDLCIMLSCDYNSRIKGYPPDGKNHKKEIAVGMKGAIAMMTEYKSIENAEPYILDVTPLNYKRCRELFTPASKDDLKRNNFKIEHQKDIDLVVLKEFLLEYSIRINIKYITNTFGLQTEVKVTKS